MRKILYFLFINVMILCGSVIYAQTPQSKGEGRGSPVNALFNKFPDAALEYTQEHYQDYYIVRAKPFFSDASNAWDFPVTKIRGDVLRLLYSVPAQNTPLDVYNYYLRMLQASKFKIIFKGVGTNELGPPEKWYEQLYDSESGFNPLDDTSISFRGKDHCYIAARTPPEKDNKNPVFVSLFFEDDLVDWQATIIMMDVIYVKAPGADSTNVH